MTRARSLSKLSNPAAFTVDTDNNVGVNSTIPKEKLNIVGVVSATSFFGDGSSLSGITSGATLGAASGSQRVVVTSLTSGTLTDAGTDADLAWNTTTNTLSAFNINVGGTLTYEDVTNVDSLGIVTARTGIKVTAGGIDVVGGGLTVTGVSTFSDGINVVGGGLTVTGVSTFSDDVTFIGAAANITFDKSDNAVLFADDAELKFGDGADLKIYHDGANSIIQDVGTGDLRIAGNIVKINNFNNTATMLKATEGSSVELNHNGSKKFETTNTGVTVTGTAVATSFTGDLTGDVTGNADTATALETARTIGGTSFDGTANIVPAEATNADTVDSLHASSFLRSDATDSASGTITFNGTVNIRSVLDFADDDILRMGSSDDFVVAFNSNGWNYINQKGNGIIFEDSGSAVMRLDDSGNFRPEDDQSGQLGLSNKRWNYGYFRFLRGSSVATPGVNNTSAGYTFDNGGVGYISRDGGTPLHLNRSDNGTILQFRRNNVEHGRVIINTNAAPGVSYSTNSDYRLKENVVVLDNAIDRVKQLLPKRFNFIGNGVVLDGFLAHEAQTVVPEAIDGTKDAMQDIGTLAEWDGTVLETNVAKPPANELSWEEEVTDENGNQTVETRTRTWTQTGNEPVYQGIDQAKLVPLLTAALQEAISKIETLETKVAALETAN